MQYDNIGNKKIGLTKKKKGSKTLKNVSHNREILMEVSEEFI